MGRQTIRLETPPSVAGYGNVVGRREMEGPLAACFDGSGRNALFGERTWEKAESAMQKQALIRALDRAGKTGADVDVIFAGDLLNQCISSTFALRDQGIPFLGVYGACSTMAESLALAALFIDGGFASCTAAMTSSHFCTAERQYRTPLEYGCQRTPTAQWTATAAGAVILTASGQGPYLTHVTCGRIVDKGVLDSNNMGAAMAPAARDTLAAHFADTGGGPGDYDLIVTGDLGHLGKEILLDLCRLEGIDLSSNYDDCGVLLYDAEGQDMHCGGSGCGCSAAVLTGYLLPGLREGRWKRILFAATGALLSPLSSQQRESIPSICHAVVLSTEP